jgi:hypothetical protein
MKRFTCLYINRGYVNIILLMSTYMWWYIHICCDIYFYVDLFLDVCFDSSICVQQKCEDIDLNQRFMWHALHLKWTVEHLKWTVSIMSSKKKKRKKKKFDYVKIQYVGRRSGTTCSQWYEILNCYQKKTKHICRHKCLPLGKTPF